MVPYLNPMTFLPLLTKNEGDSTKVYMTYERFPQDVKKKLAKNELIDDGNRFRSY